MPEIQSSDPGRKLQNRYSLVGASPAPFLSPELVSVVLVDDLTEFDVLDATFERPCVATLSFQATVGNFPIVRLCNPPNSGVIATVERILMESGTADLDCAVLLRPNVTVTPSDRGQFRDARLSGTPACGLGSDESAVSLFSSGHFTFNMADPPNTNLIFDLPYVLDQNSILDFYGSGVSDLLNLRMFWRERTILPG